MVAGGLVVEGAEVVVGAAVEVVVTLAVVTVAEEELCDDLIEFDEVPPAIALITPMMTTSPTIIPVINHLVLLSHFLFSQTRTSPSGQQQRSATTMIATFSNHVLDDVAGG